VAIQQKQVMSKSKAIRWLLFVVIYGVSVFLCTGAFIIGTRIVGDRSSFCSTDDELYQTILGNGLAWIESFPETYSPAMEKSRLVTTASNGRTYYAQGYWEFPQGRPMLLYIITGSDIDGLRGSNGYIYLASKQELPQYWLNNYWIKQLDENMLCYKLK
jgi:hypothetical protein